MAAVPDPLWRALNPRGPAFPPLGRDEVVDLIIVGGGFLGLSTALHAARAGLSVRVLEAGVVGGRASGLNGGQVIPGLKHDPAWLAAHFGARDGERAIAFAAGTADAVFDLIAAEKLAVPHRRAGWLQAAHTEAAARAAEGRAAEWRARGADVAFLSAAEVAALTGARGYLGGFLDRRAGTIDPLAFAHELARIAAMAGAAIAEHSRVTRLTRADGGWQVETVAGHTVTARSVVVATNAYSDALVPGLARTLITLHSFQIATEPLDADLGAAILPGGQAVSDSRRLLYYFRRSADGRFVLGGRGTMAEPTQPEDFAHLVRGLGRLYPALAGVPVAHRWYGRVAVTLDYLPHLHEPEPGLLAAAGCQGRGVGLQAALGARIAAAVATRDRGVLPFPLTPIRPIPFHRFRRFGVGAVIAWNRLLDGLDAVRTG